MGKHILKECFMCKKEKEARRMESKDGELLCKVCFKKNTKATKAERM